MSFKKNFHLITITLIIWAVIAFLLAATQTSNFKLLFGIGFLFAIHIIKIGILPLLIWCILVNSIIKFQFSKFKISIVIIGMIISFIIVNMNIEGGSIFKQNRTNYDIESIGLLILIPLSIANLTNEIFKISNQKNTA